MTARSRMSLAMASGTSTTKSDNNIRAFATLRFAGDALDPDEISRVIKEKPTKAYRKGQTYRSGPYGPDVTGRTGVWYFSTRRKIPSKDLVDHLNALDRLIAPFGDQGQSPERTSRHHATQKSPGSRDLLLAWSSRCPTPLCSIGCNCCAGAVAC